MPDSGLAGDGGAGTGSHRPSDRSCDTRTGPDLKLLGPVLSLLLVSVGPEMNERRTAVRLDGVISVINQFPALSGLDLEVDRQR